MLQTELRNAGQPGAAPPLASFSAYQNDPEALKPVWLALDRAEREQAERLRLQTGSLTRGEIASASRAAGV